jgi:hypothetical protein
VLSRFRRFLSGLLDDLRGFNFHRNAGPQLQLLRCFDVHPRPLHHASRPLSINRRRLSLPSFLFRTRFKVALILTTYPSCPRGFRSPSAPSRSILLFLWHCLNVDAFAIRSPWVSGSHGTPIPNRPTTCRCSPFLHRTLFSHASWYLYGCFHFRFLLHIHSTFIPVS